MPMLGSWNAAVCSASPSDPPGWRGCVAAEPLDGGCRAACSVDLLACDVVWAYSQELQQGTEQRLHIRVSSVSRIPGHDSCRYDTAMLGGTISYPWAGDLTEMLCVRPAGQGRIWDDTTPVRLGRLAGSCLAKCDVLLDDDMSVKLTPAFALGQRHVYYDLARAVPKFRSGRGRFYGTRPGGERRPGGVGGGPMDTRDLQAVFGNKGSRREMKRPDNLMEMRWGPAFHSVETGGGGGGQLPIQI